jgi:asparagine synthetase B (glutamine-hydrolysing)
MKINVSFNQAKAAFSQSLGYSSFEIIPNSSCIEMEVDQTLIYLEGEFYYYNNEGENVKINKNNANAVIKQALLDHSVSNISSVLEGVYCGVAVDKNKKTLYVFSDAFNRKNFFYTQDGDQITLSTSLNEVLNTQKSIKYDQNGLYSFLLLGYTPVKNTFYENVFRLGCDEIIKIDESGVSKISTSKIVDIQEYDKSKIDLYEKNLENAVLSRASDSNGNIVMNSGGWDSTTLVYLLTKNFDKKNVKSVVFEMILSDKQSFNVYEVDKVKRISKHFDIETETCTIDYSNKEMIDLWERNLDNLRNNHVYFWIHHLKLAEQVGSKTTSGSSIFSGEASDSIHNFGYSQFVSVNYDNMLLREYADKAKSYLYGPTFLKHLKNGKLHDDKVFQFFNAYYGKEKFSVPVNSDSIDLMNKYFQSFILSYQRVPFANWKSTTFVSDLMNTEFERFINENYFEDLSKQTTPENLYYNLLQIYKRIHFQSAQIQVAGVAFSKYNLTCKIPFMDLNMVDYMYRMPEDWGRGLELKTTKYPLRYLANERWSDMPLHILEEGGPHSYIAENDKKWTYAGGNWDIYCEILYSSVFKDYFKEMFAKVDIEKYFDADYFNTDFFKKVIKDYIDGVEDIANHALLFKLAVLFSIGLIER